MTVLHVASHKNIRYVRSINNKVVRNKLNEYNGTSVTTFQKPSRNSQDPLNHHYTIYSKPSAKMAAIAGKLNQQLANVMVLVF